ncbi:MAG: ABC transporter permease [Crocinitomicaceae bacterium]|nr:ABC transporter permease [Crocinitomicaceae bacterium]NGF75458.1 ABC transporter permease [Fluviicola sp. SGL-29]
MRNSWIIALREVKERIGSRSYVLFAIFGPLIILGLVYLLFVFGGNEAEKWNILVTDKAGILDNKLMPHPDPNVTYSFANDYIEHTDFANGKRYQQYDAMVEINEKVLSNKLSYVFYRTKPSFNLQAKVQYQVERRLEEVMIQRFTDLSVQTFREVKQPIKFSFRNVYDPYDQTSDVRTWVGFFFGMVILAFIALFGMTILRSVTSEKSNRIVEVLLASVRPQQLLFGKLTGVGISAFIQFFIWIIFIGLGLYLMREWMFPSIYDASSMNMAELTDNGRILSVQEKLYAGKEFNTIVDLVYERVNFGVMLTFFVLFFIGGYLFYGSFFAAIGSTAGTENDGQQFILPVLLILALSAYAGYYTVANPESELTGWLHYIPFTSPVVVMVKLTYGYAAGEAYQIWLSLIVLLLSAFFCLSVASRLYKNGVLQFGHRLKLQHLFKWLRK